MLKCRRAPQPPSTAASPLLTMGLSTGSWTRHPYMPMSSMRLRPSQAAAMCSPCGSLHSRTRALSTSKQATSGPQPHYGSQVGCVPSAVVGTSPCGSGHSVILGLTEKVLWAGPWIPGWTWAAGCGGFRMTRCTGYTDVIPWSAWHRSGHAPVVWKVTQSLPRLCPQPEVDRWALT